jgi:hypothetical protein
MERIFTHADLKRIAAGVAVACTAGLLMGAALRPDLDEHDAAGPQMLMGDGGPRKVFAAYDQGMAAYSGQVPEYVVGTDWTRPRAMPEPRPVAAEDTGDVMAYAAEDAAVEVSHASYAEEPRPAPRYPSMAGNADYEANLPGPPAPPADIDSEPAITG